MTVGGRFHLRQGREGAMSTLLRTLLAVGIGEAQMRVRVVEPVAGAGAGGILKPHPRGPARRRFRNWRRNCSPAPSRSAGSLEHGDKRGAHHRLSHREPRHRGLSAPPKITASTGRDGPHSGDRRGAASAGEHRRPAAVRTAQGIARTLFPSISAAICMGRRSRSPFTTSCAARRSSTASMR